MTEPNEENPRQSFFKTFFKGTLSGGLGGALEVLVDHPLWTLKTRLQDPNIPRESKFTMNPRILYRGLGPNMASMMPITALQIGAAGGVKRAIANTNEDKEISELCTLFSSAMGGFVSATVSSPTELIMSRQTEHQGFYATMKDMIRREGARSLGKGFWGTANRDAIFTSAYLFGVPYIKNKLQPHLSEKGATLAGGVVAGTTGALLSQPFDALKTAQQVSHTHTSMWRIAKEKVRQEGLRGLYKGGVPRTLRVISAVTLISSVDQKIRTMCRM
ncbi:MAG: MC/SLC25 family protein [Gammaproteobacteria bacterium]